MKIVTLAIVAAALLATGCANTERSRDLGNPNIAGITLAQQVCSNCHGMNGTTVSPNFPNLAGQTEPYVVAQLKAFRSHDRRDPAGFEYMWGLSRSLTDAQIQGLAAYYAGQTPVRQALEGGHGKLEAGKAIFETGVSAAGVPGLLGLPWCAGPWQCHVPAHCGPARRLHRQAVGGVPAHRRTARGRHHEDGRARAHPAGHRRCGRLSAGHAQPVAGQPAAEWPGSGDHGRRAAPGAFADARERVGQGDQPGQRLLGLDRVLRRVGLVALEIDTQRRAFGAGAREAEDDARTVRQTDADALRGADRAVDRVGVAKSSAVAIVAPSKVWPGKLASDARRCAIKPFAATLSTPS